MSQPSPENSTERRPLADSSTTAVLAEWTELLRRSRWIRMELAARLAGSSISDIQLLAMWLCRRRVEHAAEGGVPQLELAAALALSPAQTSHVLEQLRQQGWLVSHRPAQDRRRQLWRLTPSGEQQLHSAMARLPGCATRFEPLAPGSAAPPGWQVFRGEQDGDDDSVTSNRLGGERC